MRRDFDYETLRLWKYPVSHTFRLLVLASTDDSCLQQLSLWRLIIDGFLFLLCLLHLLIGFLCKEELSLFIDLHQNGLTDIYFMIGYNLILSLFILLLKSFQLWPFRSLIRLYLLTCPIIFQSFFWALPFCFRLVLYFPCTNLGINHFSKKYQFFLLENGFRNLGGGGRACCFWGIIASRSSWWTRNICMDTNIHTHLHLFQYVSV